MTIQKSWRRFTVWCAIGLTVGVGLVNPASCFAWTVAIPKAGTTISNAVNCTGSGLGTGTMGHTYKMRLYSNVSGNLEGEGPPVSFAAGGWSGAADKITGLQFYTTGSASAEIWEVTGGVQNPLATSAVTVS